MRFFFFLLFSYFWSVMVVSHLKNTQKWLEILQTTLKRIKVQKKICNASKSNLHPSSSGELILKNITKLAFCEWTFWSVCSLIKNELFFNLKPAGKRAKQLTDFTQQPFFSCNLFLEICFQMNMCLISLNALTERQSSFQHTNIIKKWI